MAKRRRSAISATTKARRRNLGFESLEERALLALTHLYTFNDGTMNDWVGGANGTLRNGAAIVNGRLLLQNEAISSGQSTRVQYGQLPAGVLPNGAATIEVWYTTSNAAGWSRVFDIGNQVGTEGDSYLYFTASSGNNDTRVALSPSGGGADTTVMGTQTADLNQHMAAVVIDTTAGLLRLFIDGTQRSTAALNGANGGSITDTLAYLGRSLWNSDTGFSGAINEVRIFDEALPSGLIATHASRGATTAPFLGDFDGDSDADGDDFLTWQRNLGTSNAATDVNLNGVVDTGDLDFLRTDFGRDVAVSTTALALNNEARTLASLANTVVTMTGRSELRITGTGNVLGGSTVHLNSQDAWLFLTQIEPSAVNAAILSQIRVNGAAAVRGVNVRIVQYEMGTVVIPHAPSLQPLQTFSLPEFQGASQSFGQYVYYDTAGELGGMNLNVSSFKLKRGYMATIATNANGSGSSRVYVAQDHDLDVSILPGTFDNTIRYIYVTPWRWVSKKGASDLSPNTLDAAWNYNWNNDQNSTLDTEYVPIRQQRWWPGYPLNKPDTTTLLGYNEPNNPVEDAYESLNNGSVDAAIAAWPELMATGHRLGSPAVTDGGKAWLYEFMDKAIAANLRVDFIAIHNYQAGNSAASLQSWLKDVYDRYKLPIWLTEFNNGANWTGGTDPTYAQNATAIGSFINMMDTTPWIERYSIYSRVEAVREMTYTDGTLTPAGQVYYDNASPIGYVQQGVPASNSEGGIAQYLFEGNTLDSSGYGNNGQAVGAPAYVAGQQGQALNFDGTHNYVRLNDNVASGNEFSFAGWVNWDGGANWQRLFDFGNDTNQYMFLTPSNGSSMRFVIKNGGAEQIVQTTPLAIGQWTHLAVTLGGGTARIYVNGVQVATGAMTIRPGDFDPKVNYLGKSQFADPLFNGRLDDVRIKSYVLTPAQIAGLMTNAAPQFASTTITLDPAVRGVAYAGTLAGSATDADAGDTLTYTKIKGPAWLTVAADGTLGGTPPLGETARQEFVVTAHDADAASSFVVLTLTLSNPAAEAAASYAVVSAEDSGGLDAGNLDATAAWSLAQAMAADGAFDELGDSEVQQAAASGAGTTASYASAGDDDFVASSTGDNAEFDLATPAQADNGAELDESAWDELLDAALAVNVGA
jgi:hypothetical protein